MIFKMEFIPSKILWHAVGLSRLTFKYNETLEDTVITALKADIEIKNILSKVVPEQPHNSEEIKIKTEDDAFMRKMIKYWSLKQIQKSHVTEHKIIMRRQRSVDSMCDVVLMYA